MIPSLVSTRVVLDRLAIIDEMIKEIRALPLSTLDTFLADRRNIWTADACLRRSLEALLDIGRHILAKGFNLGVSEYKEIARGLRDLQVLSPDQANLLSQMAGYRNRLVHFYHEITPNELYLVCSNQLGDVEQIADAYRHWLRAHPEKVNDQL